VIQLCGIEDLKPGAPTPVVKGTGAMVIPTDIGTILENNCGCHYADMLDPSVMVADYNYPEEVAVKLSTWQEWQAEHAPMMKPTRDYVLERISVPSVGAAMPPPQVMGYGCNLGGGEAMADADRQTLIDWIMAGTPDGASWMP
jgi:hypothetical protein